VVEAHRVTGSDRLVLKVVAQSVDHLDGIIRQLSQLGTPTVSIVLSTRRQAVSHVRERGNQRLAAAASGERRAALKQDQKTRLDRGGTERRLFSPGYGEATRPEAQVACPHVARQTFESWPD